VKTYYSGMSGLTLLAGLGAFVGIAYVLTRKEEKALPPPPPKTPSSPPPAPVITFTSAPAPAPVPGHPMAQPVARAMPVPALDPTLTAQEVEAVLFALSRETDPQKLLGFASSWGASAPLTTALLLSRAQVLSGRMGS
jgi:hypothetical protein